MQNKIETKKTKGIKFNHSLILRFYFWLKKLLLKMKIEQKEYFS